MASYLIEASFLDSAHELPKDIARKVWKALSLLSKNPRHPGLHVEDLRGKAEGLQSARVDDQYRIILQPDTNVPRLLFVGPHDKAYQFAERTSVTVPLEPELRREAEPGVLYSLDLAALSRPPVIPDNTVKELLLRTVARFRSNFFRTHVEVGIVNQRISGFTNGFPEPMQWVDEKPDEDLAEY